MNRKQYKEAELELIAFDCNDIIVTSPPDVSVYPTDLENDTEGFGAG